MSNFIEQLQEKRVRWVKTSKENDFEEGITNLLTELYPDNAHFIYELLQNAEDTGAKKVSFELQTHKLIFTHNGKKLFCDKDIEAITNIGKGTKKEDVNQIGKFGVGFKSVFSYTKSPSIYSGDYNFIITDLVVPQTIKPIDKKSNETVFVFPFNNPLKDKNKAYEEIKEGLSNINRTTLLFLKSISEIEVKISNETYSINKQTDAISKTVTITNTKSNKQTKFLVFTKPFPEEEKLYVSIAFRLTKNGETTIDNKAKVSIFFPAEKETSNLKFHIHAPFASTVARDSISDREENKVLIELIADLLCEATEWIKDKGLLDDNYIGCLPIDDDNLSDFYKPIQLKIIDLFNTKPFLLCDDNKYHPAKYCWQATNQIKELITTQDLKILQLGKINADCFWTARPFQKYASGRVNKFLKSLMLNTYSQDEFKTQILEMAKYFKKNPNFIKEGLINWRKKYGWQLNEEYVNKISYLLNTKLSDKEIVIKLYFFVKENKPKISINQQHEEIKTIINSNYYKYVLYDFLANKSDEWLKRFYELLYDVIDIDEVYNRYSEDYISKYKDLRLFVKLNNGKFNFSKRECYFPSKTNIKSIKRFIISTGIYDDNQENQNESKSKRFLKNILGVKEIAIEDEVRHILNLYKDGLKIEHVQNVEHLKIFLKYYNENKSNFEKELFEDSSFLINAHNKLTKPSFILIDKPLEQTSLAKLSNDKYSSLHTLYFEPERNIPIENFKEFLLAVRCKNTLPIEKNKLDSQKVNELRGGRKESGYCINENYRIPFSQPFESESRKIETSLVIWNSISKLNSLKIFDARYRANQSQEIEICDSDVLRTLKNSSWIPNKNGAFFKPEDITKEDLHKDFEFNNHNNWLTRIGFGNGLQNNKELKRANDVLEKEFGFPVVSLLKKAKKNGINLRNFLQTEIEKAEQLHLKDGIKNHNRHIDSNKPSLSPASVLDSEKYREKAQQKLHKNLKNLGGKRKSYNYSVKVKSGPSETREFLKKQYNGYCQICGFTFSQSGNKGNYFEMFDWLSEKISKQKSDIIEAGTALCLCSRCHSILKYGDFEAKFLDSIQNIENTDYSEFAENFDLSIDNDKIPEAFEVIEMDMYKLPIRKLNNEEHIFFTEEHFIHFYNVLTLNESIQDEEYAEKRVIQENITDVEQELPELESKKIVEIGNIVTLKYSNSNHPIKIKMVSTAQKIKDSNGNTLISASSHIGKKIIGKPVGHRFENGENTVEIVNIE